METIGIRELKERTSEILRQVREQGRSFEVTFHGRVVARLVPVSEVEAPASPSSFWEKWEQVSQAISTHWPTKVSAVEAVREVRREL